MQQHRDQCLVKPRCHGPALPSLEVTVGSQGKQMSGTLVYMRMGLNVPC